MISIKKLNKIILNSRQLKSNIVFFCNFMLIPKTALNQFLLNPIIPKKFAIYIINTHIKGAASISPEKIYNSHKNFKVPGNPA